MQNTIMQFTRWSYAKASEFAHYARNFTYYISGGVWEGEVGVPQNIMRALCAVVRPDQFKFASYGPDITVLQQWTVARRLAPGNECHG